jgi:glycosyltransferase involved in cell wall biosynthesis
LLEFPGRLPHEAIPDAIRRADFVFSATHHDGTPNSLLETMWHGGIPLCGDLESIREWITDGENGYLFDMSDPEQIARTFLRAVAERDRHGRFREINRRLIRERADYETCMARVEAFYRTIPAG